MRHAVLALALAACGGSGGTPVDAGPDAFQVVEGACQITAEAPDCPGVFVMGSRIDLTLDVEANLVDAAARPS